MGLLYTLKNEGFLSLPLQLPDSWQNYVGAEDYDSLYREAEDAIRVEGFINKALKPLLKEIFIESEPEWELMLAKRLGPQDEDEEGIWHDDGSRRLAISLSLNKNPQSISGGELLLRQKDNPQKIKTLETQGWGTLLVFATGQWGWEHKVTRVTTGNRLVLVAWLSENGRY